MCWHFFSFFFYPSSLNQCWLEANAKWLGVESFKNPFFTDIASLKMHSLSGHWQLENAQPILALHPCTAFDLSVTVTSLLLLQLSPPFFSLHWAHHLRHCALHLHVRIASAFFFPFFSRFKSQWGGRCVPLHLILHPSCRPVWYSKKQVSCTDTFSPPVAGWLSLSPVFCCWC